MVHWNGPSRRKPKHSEKNLTQFHLGKKVKFALEQAMKAKRGSRGIDLLFL
jgi:hypothetical protein